MKIPSCQHGLGIGNDQNQKNPLPADLTSIWSSDCLIVKSGPLPIPKSDGRAVDCVHGLRAEIPDFGVGASTMDSKNGREDAKLEPTD